VRVANSDADLEQWRAIRIAVEPGERAASVADMRRLASDARLLVLAERDGAVLGSGIADKSDLSGGYVCPRVLPAHRRRGVGTAILGALIRHCEQLGHAAAAGLAEDPGSLAFAHRSGFTEIDRQLQQLRSVGAEPDPVVPPGVSIVSIADRPELWPQAYGRLAGTFADMGFTSTLRVSAQLWEQEWINAPQASFAALADGAVIGVASLLLDAEQPGRAEHGYTAVRREWRGRGVATALKRTTLLWAARQGISEIQTWTQRDNAAMRALNERLGYRYGTVSIRVQAQLPLRRL
jgi:GNAT superfamily N-acetyltransferase